MTRYDRFITGDGDGKNRGLRRQLTELDWDIEPEHDLWPGISTRIRFADRRLKPVERRAWLPYAMAASVVVACISLVFSSMLFQRSEDGNRYRDAMAVYQQAQIQLIDQHHQMIRTQFLQLLQTERTNLNPQFVAELETLMLNVDEASAEIKNALAVQPNNPDYASMLVRTYQQELKFLNQVRSSRGNQEPVNAQQGIST